MTNTMERKGDALIVGCIVPLANEIVGCERGIPAGAEEEQDERKETPTHRDTLFLLIPDML